MITTSTLVTNISNLEQKIVNNAQILENANSIVKKFNSESEYTLNNLRLNYNKNWWNSLLKIGGISLILNGFILGLLLCISNLNYTNRLMTRDSQIYDKLMQIDRVQRGESKFYFDKKDNALYIQDLKKKNKPQKLIPEDSYLIGFWESFWKSIF